MSLGISNKEIEKFIEKSSDDLIQNFATASFHDCKHRQVRQKWNALVEKFRPASTKRNLFVQQL